MYEFDLVYSEDLGNKDIQIEICIAALIFMFDPKWLNSRPKSKLKDVTVIRQDSKNMMK